MTWRFKLADIRISTKLWVINALICSVFVLMSLVVFWSFRNTQGLIRKVIVHDIGGVTTNALTERELFSIQADTGLLLNTFFEKEEHLDTEGRRLLGLTQILLDHNKGRDLEKPLRLFSQKLAFLLQQCVAVNDILRLLNVSRREIMSQMDKLEEVISTKLIDETLSGDDTGIMAQMASLVASYHTSLLEIDKLRAEQWPAHYYADMNAADDPITKALDDLILHCRTLGASDMAVVQLGRKLISDLQDFRGNNQELHIVMSDLNTKIKTLANAKKQIEVTMEALDRDVTHAIQSVDTKIDRRLRITGITLLSLTAFLVVALGLATTFFFKKIIKNPIENIRKGIEGLQNGDLETRIQLDRNDEWNIIERALNTMAEELSGSYATLRFKEHIIESASSVITTADLDGKMTYINPAFLKTWGVADPAEVIGKSFTEFWIVGDRFDEIMTALQSKGDWSDEIQARRKDGSVFDVQISASMVFDAQGDPISMMASSADISERKRAEEELLKEVNVNATMAQLSKALISMVSIDKISALVMENAKRLTNSPIGYVGYIDPAKGYLICPTLTRDVWDLCRVEDKSIVFSEFTGLFGWVLNNRKPLLTNAADKDPRASGTPEGHMAIRRFLSAPASIGQDLLGQISVANADGDYSDRDQALIESLADLYAIAIQNKRDQDAMIHLRKYLQNIVDSMPSVIVGIDPDGKVTQWNREAEEITGIKAQEAQKSLLTDVFPQLAGKMEKVWQAIRERKPLKDAKAATQVNDEMRFSDVTIYPLVANDIEGAVIRVDDVTERVRMEEMMIQSEKMLSVGGLAAGMAHEINNPLAAIMQNAQVVLLRTSTDLPANQQAAEECGTNMEDVNKYMEKREILRMLNAIRASGEQAAQIVENMLRFSRKSESAFLPHMLSDLLDTTVSLASSDYDLKKKYDFRQIEIVKEYDPEMPHVLCGSTEIQQVVLNLLRNAAEAMTERVEGVGPLRIILRTFKEDDMARIEVEDNGPGMEESVRRRVFEPFFSTKEPGAGTGLGLSVSYFIITENHGGTMEVESSPGRGTKFIIRLPMKQSV